MQGWWLTGEFQDRWRELSDAERYTIMSSVGETRGAWAYGFALLAVFVLGVLLGQRWLPPWAQELWLPAVFLPGTALWFRLKAVAIGEAMARRNPAICPHCGYLANDSDPCPECGRPIKREDG